MLRTVLIAGLAYLSSAPAPDGDWMDDRGQSFACTTVRPGVLQVRSDGQFWSPAEGTIDGRWLTLMGEYGLVDSTESVIRWANGVEWRWRTEQLREPAERAAQESKAETREADDESPRQTACTRELHRMEIVDEAAGHDYSGGYWDRVAVDGAGDGVCGRQLLFRLLRVGYLLLPPDGAFEPVPIGSRAQLRVVCCGDACPQISNNISMHARPIGPRVQAASVRPDPESAAGDFLIDFTPEEAGEYHIEVSLAWLNGHLYLNDESLLRPAFLSTPHRYRNQGVP